MKKKRQEGNVVEDTTRALHQAASNARRNFEAGFKLQINDLIQLREKYQRIAKISFGPPTLQKIFEATPVKRA